MKAAFILLAALVAAATAADTAECGGHGKKGPDGKCMCKGRWEGENCDIEACPVSTKAGASKDPCSGKGVCKEGKCVCNPDATGAACDEKPCLNGCSKNGKCIDG